MLAGKKWLNFWNQLRDLFAYHKLLKGSVIFFLSTISIKIFISKFYGWAYLQCLLNTNLLYVLTPGLEAAMFTQDSITSNDFIFWKSPNSLSTHLLRYSSNWGLNNPKVFTFYFLISTKSHISIYWNYIFASCKVTLV